MTAHRYTRRRALQGAGVAFAGLTVLSPQMATAGVTHAGADLASARTATLTALVAALALGPAAGVDPDAYTAAFTDYYATSEPAFRELADGALDRLPTLAAMAPAEGLAALKAMALDPARQLVVADALMLAGLTFGRGEGSEPGYFLATE